LFFLKFFKNDFRRNGIKNEEKEEFFYFLESLANATYINFQNINNTERSDKVLERLKIQPKDYLKIIYELTEDLTKKNGTIEFKVRNFNNQDFIKTTQILTENGICYTTNSILALNLSTSLLLEDKIPVDDDYFKTRKLYYVRYGNLFDGEQTYSFIGFRIPITIYLHSPYEVMNIARTLGYTKEAYEFEAFSIEIITTDQFHNTYISQRGCRFHQESNLTHYNVYSKNLCMSECRIELAYKQCGCIPHFYPNKS
jgi:acid-sensing ion channel, other